MSKRVRKRRQTQQAGRNTNWYLIIGVIGVGVVGLFFLLFISLQGNVGITSATANSTIQGLADHIEDLLFDKFLTAIGRTEDTDEKVVRSLTQVHAQLEAVRQKSPDSSSGSEDYIRNVEAMMDAIPWRLATKGLPKEFDKWKRRAAELRAEEMMLVTSGMGGPNEKNENDMKVRILPAPDDPRAAPKG